MKHSDFCATCKKSTNSANSEIILFLCHIYGIYWTAVIFQGLTPSEIVDGYEMALDKALEILPTLTCIEIKDFRNEVEVEKGIKPSIMSKQYGNEDFLTVLITKACGKDMIIICLPPILGATENKQIKYFFSV